MPRRWPPWMASGGWRPPSRPSTVAPMRRSGSAMRPMGRRRNWMAPVRTLKKGWPASKPANSRMVVPERAQSITSSGSCKPCNPRPWTTSVAGPTSSTPTRSARTAPRVARQSAAGRKLATRLFPSAMAPSSSVRWEMDLSPGTDTGPRSGLPGCTVKWLMGTSSAVPRGSCSAGNAARLLRLMLPGEPGPATAPGRCPLP